MSKSQKSDKIQDLPRNLSSSEIDENLLSEMARKQDSRLITTDASDLDEIIKISFICACHGSIITSFRDIESEESETLGPPILCRFGTIPRRLGTPIPSHGKYAKTSTSETSLCDIPFQNTDVEYKIDDEPVLEFKYQDIDTTHLNVSLTTSETCGGIPNYRATDVVRVKQKFINDIMEEIDETCPTNNFSELGAFGDTFSTTHKNYKLQQRELKKIEQTRRKDAARRIQRLYKKSRKLLFPLKLFNSEIDHLKNNIKSNMYQKTRLMKYEKERVTTMLNKNYTTASEDVYTTDSEPTNCDAHKLIMIVTRSTPHGCKSQKYVLLSTLSEVKKTIREINKDFSSRIGELYSKMLSILKPKSGGLAMATTRLSLLDILGLGKTIIEEINGEEASTVPINVYDLSCNSFYSLPSNYAIMDSKVSKGIKLNEREMSVIRIIDDYLRSKDVAFGKSKKMKKKLTGKN
jgi:hypothetical protein